MRATAPKETTDLGSNHDLNLLFLYDSVLKNLMVFLVLALAIN